MTGYEELVKALRICSSELNCGDCPLLYRDSCSSDELMADAAAAIEALEARLGEAENSVERWKDMYLTKHEPKRGEWIEDTTTYAGPGLPSSQQRQKGAKREAD